MTEITTQSSSMNKLIIIMKDFNVAANMVADYLRVYLQNNISACKQARNTISMAISIIFRTRNKMPIKRRYKCGSKLASFSHSEDVKIHDGPLSKAKKYLLLYKFESYQVVLTFILNW